MDNRKTYQKGDMVTLKKGHPCGANRWEIIRTGVDFKLKCDGCGHVIMMPRIKFLKQVK
ncbi:MAG: DUF951 domain-containing protein [Eubacteriaceae bacterium]|jgi:hypothetical protein|nr:DUF951 domain-containing protein [Eubacteriaceae bacterium]